jgi:hypothetical protein
MSDAKDHITGFCQAFLRPEKRERLATLLTGNLRSKGVTELAHPDAIDPRHAAAWTGSDALELVKRLNELGAPETCYLISNADELDDRWMELPRALKEVLNIGIGTIVSCVPGKLAFFEGEYGEHLVLQRRPTAAR